MVWNVPMSAEQERAIHRAEADTRPMSEQLADLGLAPRIRIDIPITSAQTLRDVSEILLGLANRFAVLSSRTDVAEKNALFQAAWDIKAANRKIQSLLPRKRNTRDS